MCYHGAIILSLLPVATKIMLFSSYIKKVMVNVITFAAVIILHILGCYFVLQMAVSYHWTHGDCHIQWSHQRLCRTIFCLCEFLSTLSFCNTCFSCVWFSVEECSNRSNSFNRDFSRLHKLLMF